MRKSLDKRNDYRCKFTKNYIIPNFRKRMKSEIAMHF